MIVKILSSTGTFNAVRYNTNKINTGNGELIEIKNFNMIRPEELSPADVKNYFKAYSSLNSRVKNSQFHVAISCKGNEYSADELKNIGNRFMDKMGYEKQPYIIVFHNDTNNNHIHIVSTRVDNEGKKIDDAFEKLRSQKALQEIMKELYKIDNKSNIDLLLKYKFQTKSQLITLLKNHDFQVKDNNNVLSIYKNGVHQKDLNLSDIKYKNATTNKDYIHNLLSSGTNDEKKLTAILNSKNEIIGYKNGITDKLKEKDIDVVFHFSANKKPFGYTIIDNKSKSIIKGSDVLKLDKWVDFDEKINAKKSINKETIISDKYNISSELEREMLSDYLKFDIKNIHINNKNVQKEDLENYKNLFAKCKSVDDLSNLNHLKKFDLYSFKNNLFLITDKKQIINFNELPVEKNLINEYILFTNKSDNDIKKKNELSDDEEISYENTEVESEDKSLISNISNTGSDLISAIGGQASEEPERKRKHKRKR